MYKDAWSELTAKNKVDNAVIYDELHYQVNNWDYFFMYGAMKNYIF